MLRVLVSLSIILGCLLAMTTISDARRDRTRGASERSIAPPGGRLRLYQPPRQSSNGEIPAFPIAPLDPTADCPIEADMSGNYGGYPCWARKAFTPKGGGK